MAPQRITNSALCGAGLGLRMPHLREVIACPPAVSWFEVHICNFIGSDLNRALLRKVRENHDLSFHSVSMNLGGSDPLDLNYLDSLKSMIDEFQPALVSDHLCFTSHGAQHYHDLLPIPLNTAAVHHVADRVKQVQDVLGTQILLENVSRYYSYDESEISEGEFLRELCAQTDCYILLDLNNAYVNQYNHGDDIAALLRTLPADRIREVHLGGHTQGATQLIDSHSESICDDVWQLFESYCQHMAITPTLIEWDSNMPDFDVLIKEQVRAQDIMNIHSQKPAHAAR